MRQKARPAEAVIAVEAHAIDTDLVVVRGTRAPRIGLPGRTADRLREAVDLDVLAAVLGAAERDRRLAVLAARDAVARAPAAAILVTALAAGVRRQPGQEQDHPHADQ